MWILGLKGNFQQTSVQQKGEFDSYQQIRISSLCICHKLNTTELLKSCFVIVSPGVLHSLCYCSQLSCVFCQTC